MSELNSTWEVDVECMTNITITLSECGVRWVGEHERRIEKRNCTYLHQSKRGRTQPSTKGRIYYYISE